MVDLKEIIKGFCEKCKLELYDTDIWNKEMQ